MGFFHLGEATMKGKHILLGCALATLSANVIAADKAGRGYVGAGYTMLTVSPEGGPDLDLSALGVRGGYYFNKYFSVEGRLAIGVGDDSITETVFDPVLGFITGTLTTSLDYSLGVYAVGHIPVTEQFQLYGLAGFTQHSVNLEVCVTGFGCDDESYDDSDLSFGVGAEFDMTKNLSLGVEYVSYFTDGEIEDLKYDTDGLGITLNYIF
jgi:outer membrane immunogenic protein